MFGPASESDACAHNRRKTAQERAGVNLVDQCLRCEAGVSVSLADTLWTEAVLSERDETSQGRLIRDGERHLLGRSTV